jgi:diguanylate cyclase
MTGRTEDYERTMAFADIALGQMKALRQVATPRNYEIWYAYASGYHPALNQQVNAPIKAKGTISEADLAQIYENHLSPTRLTERIDLVGSQVKGEIDQVMAMIDAAVGSATSYTESLAGASQQLDGSKDREGLRASSKVWCKPQRPWRLPTGNWKNVSPLPSWRSMNFRKTSRWSALKV